MASVGGAIGVGLEVDALESEGVPRFSLGAPKKRRHRIRWWRFFVMLLAGLYFLLPLYAALKFTFENTAGKLSLQAVRNLPSAPGFAAAAFLSMRLALVTVVLAMVLMVPTVIYVHLRLPKIRPIMEFVTVLPIVIPPIVLIIGVLGSAPLWLKASPYLLSLLYVILAMPFVYRALDAGLNAIDLKTLVEASRSLGGNWIRTLRIVILPNLKSALTSAIVLTLALVLGEYTMASLDLWTTIPVWIVQFNAGTDGHVQVAAAMLLLVGTWVLLSLIVSLDRSQSRRSLRKAGAP